MESLQLILLIVSSALFFITHIALSHGEIREGLIKTLSEWGFRGVYSAVAIVTLGVAVWMMAVMPADKGPVFWEPVWWVYGLSWLFMLLALFLLLMALANPSPTGMMPASLEPRGILRVTRHPMNMGLALFGLAHMLGNGNLGDLFFFGAFFATGFIGAYHQDARKRRLGGEEFAIFANQTSILPLAAVVRGKTRLSLAEFNKPMAIAAVIAFVVLVVLHQRIFGSSPF